MRHFKCPDAEFTGPGQALISSPAILLISLRVFVDVKLEVIYSCLLNNVTCVNYTLLDLIASCSDTFSIINIITFAISIILNM